MLRVMCCSLMNVIPVVTTIFGAAYAVQPGYGIGFEKDVYLWIPVLGNIVAVLVIPFVGNLSDKIGRRPPIIVGALASGLLSFGYLYAISIHNVPLAIAHVAADVGRRLPGLQRHFPELLPRDVPDAHPGFRDGHLAEPRDARHRAASGALRRRGAARSDQHPVHDRVLTFGITCIAAIAAWTARETYRVHMNDLGNPNAVPVPKEEYDRLRAKAIADGALAKAPA